VFWAVPEVALKGPPGGPSRSGGLVGVIMNASALSKMGMRFKVIFGEPTDQKAFARLKNTIEAVRVLKALRTSRVGIVGHHSPGFYDGSVDEVALKQCIGTELVHIDLSELNSVMQRIADSDAVKAHQEVSSRIVDLTHEERVRDGKIFLGLKQLVQSNKLDAIAVKCWPELEFSSCDSSEMLARIGVLLVLCTVKALRCWDSGRMRGRHQRDRHDVDASAPNGTPGIPLRCFSSRREQKHHSDISLRRRRRIFGIKEERGHRQKTPSRLWRDRGIPRKTWPRDHCTFGKSCREVPHVHCLRRGNSDQTDCQGKPLGSQT